MSPASSSPVRRAVPIAPSGPLPGRAAAAAAAPGAGTTSRRADDVVVTPGGAFNGRGYRVCGVANKRGHLCGRIGTCPFHKGRGGDSGENGKGAGKEGTDDAVRLAVAPMKSRFKRSWTKEEHSRFLVGLDKFGKGKWKEIAAFVGTRTGSQCQSHACKYFKRQAKDASARRKHSIHDITEPEVAPAPDKPMAPPGAPRPAAVPVLPADVQLLMPSAAYVPAAVVQPVAPSVLSDEMEDGEDAESVADAPGEAPVYVTVRVNGRSGSGARMQLPASMERDEFLQRAKLHVRAGVAFTRIFVRSGCEIDSLDELCEDEAIWLSHGEEFLCGEDAASASSGLEGEDVGVSAGGVETAGMARISVTVRLNGPVMDMGHEMLLPESMCWEEFLRDAGQRLGFPGSLRRIFARSGSEITNLDEVIEDEHLWLSAGAEFSFGGVG